MTTQPAFGFLKMHVCYVCTCLPQSRFKTLRDANMDLMKLCEEHDTSYEKGRLDMQQYR